MRSAGAKTLTSAAMLRDAATAAAPLEREQKRLLDRAQAQELLERIAGRVELEIHDPARPVELTWTTYLDTDDLRFFASSRAGPARRVRIREYASCAAPSDLPARVDVSFLELKESAGGQRRKVRHRADRAGIARVLEALRRGEAPDGDAALAELARALAGTAVTPRVCTLYRRLSLAVGARVRITLDEDVRFHRPPADATAIGPVETLLGAVPGVVVEVKGPGALPGWLSAALERFEPLPELSKFRLGFQLLTRHADAHPVRRLVGAPGEAPLVVPGALRRRVVRRRW